MAGTAIKISDGFIEFDDGGVTSALERLGQFGGDMEDCFDDIGEYLLRVTAERFESESGPGGEPWQDVAPKTREKKRHPKILTESGHLRGSFSYAADATELVFGTNVIYAAIHQFGGEAVGSPIPARPFLGFDSDDEERIYEIVLKHLSAAGGAPGGNG